MEGNLSLGLLLLGLAGIAGFMAFRPWPVPGGQPIKPGTYAVEILRGSPPAAGTESNTQRQADITAIEGGLAALLGVWALSKLAGAISPGGITGASGGTASDEEKTASTADEGLEQDLGTVVSDIGEDVVP